MRRPGSMWSLETLGRVRLSRHFYMRDFLYSEIGSFHRIPNIPEDPDLAIAHGRRLCEELLDPLQETFGRIAIRSGYRSSELNRFGNERKLTCARKDANYGHHIWDRVGEGGAGAGTSLVISHGAVLHAFVPQTKWYNGFIMKYNFARKAYGTSVGGASR